MYMPYLYGKQEELFALIDLGARVSESTIAIIKPVRRDWARLARIAPTCRFALITNPDKGKPQDIPTYAEVRDQITNATLKDFPDRVLPAFELRGGSTQAELRAFCSDFAARECVVVHKDHTLTPVEVETATARLASPPMHVFVEPGVSASAFAALPASQRVLLRDGFRACARNADYPRQSAFDDLAYQYATRGFGGFGDFCTIGDRFSLGGGPALAVAIHISEDTGTAIVVNHFKSTVAGVNLETMYFEAADALIANVGNPARAGMRTLGVERFLQRRWQQLGRAKRLSIMHHIELVQAVS